MSDIPREYYIDRVYKKLMRTKSGKKVIVLLRTLVGEIKTRREIKEETGFSTSEVRKLILKAEKEGYIENYNHIGFVIPRRRPINSKRSVKETGRPPTCYALTSQGWWLIRLDPEVKHRWKELESSYEKIMEFSAFESYANLIYAIQEHPQLREYRKPYYFMDQELQLTIFNPFIYIGAYPERAVDLYDELIRVLKEYVRSEHVLHYYLALKESASEIAFILNRHSLILEKMETLPEVRDYLEKESG